ncbi:MAG: MBL fold metallo-hydrolase [Methanomassiliicoccales archaeon]|nr:MAG: MBL fold metallo-hydrolase [Methanomassiliicoccales archaeon]
MLVRRIRSEGISHNSYFVGDGNEAAVIDPRRDIEEYLDIASANEMTIRYVLETHRNEDLVSGSTEIASATGAKVLHGGQTPFRYGHEVHDGQRIEIGRSVIVALHTPGHTPESFSYVLYDLRSPSYPLMVFCGDTIFPGDVGRTDFFGPNVRGRMAADLFDSITRKLLPLGAGTILLPAHGPGSLCGANIEEREETTIGTEMALNRMLKMSREDFISWKIKEELEISPIFARMEAVNLEGARPMGRIAPPHALLPKEVKHLIVKGAMVLDTRKPHHFAAAHVPGAINLGVDFIPVYAPYVLPADRPLVLVTDCPAQTSILQRHLLRIGYDNIVGVLKGSMELWLKGGNETSRLEPLSAKGLSSMLSKKEDVVLIDVRDMKEITSGTVPGAKMIHLGMLQSKIGELPKNKPIVTFCGSGFRGSCAASILLRNGFSKVMNLSGGFEAWTSSGFQMGK